MKLYTKMVLMIILSAISLKLKAQAVVVKYGGDVTPVAFKYILHHRSSMYRNHWYKIPGTNQQIYILAYLPNYLPNINDNQVDGLILLPWNKVKPGNYRNNGYDGHGMKVPVQQEYYPILSGDKGQNFYYCTPDSIAVAKANCMNEQDYVPIIVQQIVYTPPPAEKPAPIVIPVAPKEEYKYNCLGKVNFTGGEERFSEGGDIAIGKYSTHGEFYFHYRDKSWWQRDPFTGLYDSLICPERKVANCNCPKEKPKPKTEPVEIVQKPYYYHTESKKWFFRIDLTPSYGGYQQQYQPQQRQRYYEEPRQQQPQQQQWGNYRPFDTGNQPVDRSFDTGAQQQQIDRSFDIGNRNNSSNNDRSFDRGGYIDGVNERVR